MTTVKTGKHNSWSSYCKKQAGHSSVRYNLVACVKFYLGFVLDRLAVDQIALQVLVSNQLQLHTHLAQLAGHGQPAVYHARFSVSMYFKSGTWQDTE
jgi:hypothetical protein